MSWWTRHPEPRYDDYESEKEYIQALNAYEEMEEIAYGEAEEDYYNN